MALPARIPKPLKRSKRWRSAAHCNFVRQHGCSIPGCVGRPIEVAHVRFGSGAGMAQKPSDDRTVSLCREHHQVQHTIGEPAFWARYKLVAQQDVEQLIAEFCAASPKAAEIARIKREREHGA